jgi:hypothetical protein
MPTIAETHSKIDGFEAAAPGWHFGDGIPARHEAVVFARLLNDTLQDAGFPSTDAFLGVGGQIQVNGYWGNRFMELIIEDLKIYFLIEKNRKFVFEEKNLDIMNAISRIRFWGVTWAMSEFSTQMISTGPRETLPIPHSLNQVPVASLLLTPNASTQLEEIFVNISGAIINPAQDPSQVNRPFTWKSPKNTYQNAAAS